MLLRRTQPQEHLSRERKVCSRVLERDGYIPIVKEGVRDVMRAHNAGTPAARPARSKARLRTVSLSRVEVALVRAAPCFDATDTVSVTGVRKIVHVRFPTRAVCVLVRCAVVF